MKTIIIFSLVILYEGFKIYAHKNSSLNFPKGFLIGVSTSAYQMEGAWNEGGKSPSLWDHFSHARSDLIIDKSNGDIATDYYHRYKEDLKLLKSLNIDHYRFSISWSRILPTGYTDVINQEAVNHYHSILDELDKYGIIPFVTIYHWDHPQRLEDQLGGWLSERMAYIYAEYANVIFREFGHRIKYFITINEPWMYCSYAYRIGLSPGHILLGSGEYYCLQNFLKGHALAYNIYKDRYRDKYGGKLSFTSSLGCYYNKNESDKGDLNDLAFELKNGISTNPVYSKDGDFPEILKKRVAERSKAQGLSHSRLPIFTDYWIKFIRGTYDFFALNHYSCQLVEQLPLSDIANWSLDDGMVISFDPKWPGLPNSFVKKIPKGLGDILRKIKDKYGNPPVYITENGWTSEFGTDDPDRIDYIKSYMQEMLLAISRDGCDVRAYTYWSFTDSYEWAAGYTLKFGLVEVDFTSKNLTRTPKKSFEWFKNIIKCRSLDNCLAAQI